MSAFTTTGLDGSASSYRCMIHGEVEPMWSWDCRWTMNMPMCPICGGTLVVTYLIGGVLWSESTLESKRD